MTPISLPVRFLGEIGNSRSLNFAPEKALSFWGSFSQKWSRESLTNEIKE